MPTYPLMPNVDEDRVFLVQVTLSAVRRGVPKIKRREKWMDLQTIETLRAIRDRWFAPSWAVVSPYLRGTNVQVNPPIFTALQGLLDLKEQHYMIKLMNMRVFWESDARNEWIQA